MKSPSEVHLDCNVIHSREVHRDQWTKSKNASFNSGDILKIEGYAIIPLDEYAELLMQTGDYEGAKNALHHLFIAELKEQGVPESILDAIRYPR